MVERGERAGRVLSGADRSATIGFLVKTGRAIAVVLAGPVAAPSLVERREIALYSRERPETMQPHHRVMQLPWPQALAKVRPAVDAIEELAVAGLRGVVHDVAAAGAKVRAVGVVGSHGNDPARIANPHIRAHAAEGQLFRRAIEHAALSCDLPFISFAPKDVSTRVAKLLMQRDAELQARAAALGAGTRPWRAEERAAALAAWAALASASGIVPTHTR